MELDDMKQLWQQYDVTTKQHTIINEKLINFVLRDKSETAISKILNWEYLGVAVAAIVLLFLLINTSAASSEISLSVSYFISLAFVVMSIIFSVYKIKHLHSIDTAVDSVTSTAEKTERFRLMIVKERIITLAATPVFIVSMFAVMMLYIYNVNVFDNIFVSLPRLLLGFVAAIVLMTMMYKRLYFKNIREIINNLKEIEEFKKE